MIEMKTAKNVENSQKLLKFTLQISFFFWSSSNSTSFFHQFTERVRLDDPSASLPTVMISETCTMAPTLMSPRQSSAWLLCMGRQQPEMATLPVTHQLTPCLSHGSPGDHNWALPTAQHGHSTLRLGHLTAPSNVLVLEPEPQWFWKGRH